MTAHDEAIKIARQAWGRQLVLAMDAGVSPRRSAIEIGLEAYLAAMLASGWRMMPREPDHEMKAAVSRHATTCLTMDGKATAWDWTVLHRIAFDSAPIPSGTEG